MSIYSQAMGVSTDLLREETRVLGEAGSKEIKSKEFVLDKTIEYNKAATEAATKYGNWKNTLGTIASIAAVASGVGAPMAALIAGGGTLAGGAIGKHQAKVALKGRDQKWMQSQEEDLLKGMTKSTYTGALTSAVTAGIGASSAQAASETAAKEAAQKALGENVAEGAGKKGLGELGGVYSGTEAQNKALLKSGGYTGESIVDELKGAGLDYDWDTRTKMFTEMQGIEQKKLAGGFDVGAISQYGDPDVGQLSDLTDFGKAAPTDPGSYQNIWSPDFAGKKGKQSLMNLRFAAEGALGAYGKNPLSKKGWFK